MTPDSDLDRLAQELGLPLMVKPPHEGSTLGVTRVDELAGLRKAYELAALYDDEVVAEQFIKGRELTVPLLGKGTAARSAENRSELQSLMRITYADFCLKKQQNKKKI